jgi:hypothetical protein
MLLGSTAQLPVTNEEEDSSCATHKGRRTDVLGPRILDLAAERRYGGPMKTVMQDRQVKCGDCNGRGTLTYAYTSAVDNTWIDELEDVCVLCNGTGWEGVEFVEVEL